MNSNNRRDTRYVEEYGQAAVKKLLGMKYGAVILAVLIVLSAGVYVYMYMNGMFDLTADAELHFIDVGQGDASLILTDEVAILVDCGTREYSDKVIEYVRRYTDRIDMFVFSHAHDDHMGGADDIINSIDVDEVLMTQYASDSAFFGRALDAIEENGVTVTEAAAGNTYYVGDVTIQVLSPVRDYEDLNNNSIIMRVLVDSVSFMFTGDAEYTSEREAVDKYGDLMKSDVLKVGHHGSSTSTSEVFFDAVSPEYAVISCGENNSYGHPHRETLKLFNERSVNCYRTDKSGSIVFRYTDGQLEIEKEY